MSRPTWNLSAVASGQAGWDAPLNSMLDDAKDVILGGPIPIYQHSGNESDVGTSWPAASYDRCLCWVNHSTRGWVLMYSDGSTWRVYGRAAAQADSVAGTVADLRADFNTFLAGQRAAGLLGTPTP